MSFVNAQEFQCFEEAWAKITISKKKSLLRDIGDTEYIEFAARSRLVGLPDSVINKLIRRMITKGSKCF